MVIYSRGLRRKTKRSKKTTVLGIYELFPHEAYCSTPDASKSVSRQLQRESFQKDGIRHCWFIRVIDEVFSEIKELQEFL